MSRKLNYIPYIPDYESVRRFMADDLAYRLETRHKHTSLGRPLYYRINVQVIMTQECPYHCPFCIERQNPMKGAFDADAQLNSLKKVLLEHPATRLTITGGEPGLYPVHAANLVNTFKRFSENVFCSINTAGFNPEISTLAHINLSVNDFVHPDPLHFPGCTVQTVLPNDRMNISYIKLYMKDTKASSFSFRYLTRLEKTDYPVKIFNQLANDPAIKVHTFRTGDFFTYVTFDYQGKHARITLGDMYQQSQNNYQDGYSNIIIHPDGRIGVNWH